MSLKLAAKVSGYFLGKRVGVKWLYNACGVCEICFVDETSCPYQNNTGRSVPGTFQQYIVAHVKYVVEIPDELDPQLAAPLLCAGLTMYSAIKKTNLKEGDWLALPGAGGGLGHLGLQLAKKKGFKVIAIDSGVEKRELCMRLGATEFLDYKTDAVREAVMKLTSGYGTHAVVCTASSLEGYRQALGLIRNRGTLVCIGLTEELLPISPFEMVIRGLRIVGSSVGTSDEMEELLQLALAGNVVASVEVLDFDMVNDALHKLEKSQISGRLVLRIPP